MLCDGICVEMMASVFCGGLGDDGFLFDRGHLLFGIGGFGLRRAFADLTAETQPHG